MKKLLLAIMLIVFVNMIIFTINVVNTVAEVRMDTVVIQPPTLFVAPPVMILLPNTLVYACPDVRTDFFYADYWYWQYWEGQWWRTRNYNGRWEPLVYVPSFYTRHVPPDWRKRYEERRWNNQAWRVERVPHPQLEQHQRAQKQKMIEKQRHHK
jgi:hypothetical protein